MDEATKLRWAARAVAVLGILTILAMVFRLVQDGYLARKCERVCEDRGYTKGERSGGVCTCWESGEVIDLDEPESPVEDGGVR